MDAPEGSSAEVSRRQALRLAAVVGSLGVALGARPATAEEGASVGRSILIDTSKVEKAVLKVLAPGRDAATPPTVLQEVDLTAALLPRGGTAPKLTRIVIEASKQAPPYTARLLDIEVVAAPPKPKDSPPR